MPSAVRAPGRLSGGTQMSRKHPLPRLTEAELAAARQLPIYPVLIEWGQRIAACRVILRQGEQRWRPPDESTRAAVNEVWDLDRLERILDRLLQASSWQDLLATP